MDSPSLYETTTQWEFLFPEVKKETEKASQNVREDLSSFLSEYAQGLDDLYQAIDQNPCRTWSISTAPVTLTFPFPTHRTLDEFFEGQDFDILYPIKLLTGFVQSIHDISKKLQRDFFPKLAVFGDGIDDTTNPFPTLDTDCGIPKGTLEVMTAEILPLLQDLSNLLPEYFAIGQRLIEYCLFLYSNDNPMYSDFFSTTTLSTAFSAIGLLLRHLYILENLINNSPPLITGFSCLKKLIEGIGKDPTAYNSNQNTLSEIEASLSQIHRVVFNGDILGLFIVSLANFTLHPSNKAFCQQLEIFLEDEISHVSKLIKTGEHSDCEVLMCDLTLLIKLLDLFNYIPKKPFKGLYSLQIISLFHYVNFSPVFYLSQNHPSFIEPDALKLAQQKMPAILSAHDAGLAGASLKVFTMFSQWQSKCSEQLLKGLNLANFLKNLIAKTIDLHESMNKGLDLQNAEHLCRLVTLSKAVHATFLLNQSAVTRNLPSAVEKVTRSLEQNLHRVAAALRKHAYRSVRTRASNIIQLAYHCVMHATSQFSTNCLSIIADLFDSKSLRGLGFTRYEIFHDLRAISMLTYYNLNSDAACDLSFLVNSRDFFREFLIFTQKTPRRIQYLTAAMNDIYRLFEGQAQVVIGDYFKKLFDDHFLNPILNQIETELRFHSHQHLAVSERNPLKKQYLALELDIPPFRLMNSLIDIKQQANFYFTKIFYNETAVSPQVWETYAEMANLASKLYDLKITDCRVPGSMMQQEVDVLEITRSLARFVSTHSYDLNSQVFVQRAEDSHHIAIVGIPHVSASFRCHGIGIVNTTVDFVYRYLRTKFNNFSKILFDDAVRGKLLIQKTEFEKNGIKFEKAEQTYNELKKVLNILMQIITEIGNSLGFVRMVKSGGARFLNNAVGFICDTDISFKQSAEDAQLKPHVVESTGRLDSVVGRLTELFEGGESYFKMLVDVFSGPFRDKKNSHLQSFYLAIPALTIGYVEHIEVMKDKAMKQNKNASFSDDGFPMGVAYILKLLEQDALFDSLHWFDCLKVRAKEEREEASRGSKKGVVRQTAKLALQMIDRREREYELLETTVHSARILFN